MSTAIWSTWWKIADEHAAEARREANRNGEMMGDVMEEAMVAIAAAASAVGGFAASIRLHSEVERFDQAEEPSASWLVMETLKRASKLGPRTNHFQAEVKWLFNLRDPLVHPGEKMREPVPHMDRPDVQVSVESSSYSAANAERAVRLVRELVTACRASARPAAVAWFENRAILISMRLGEPEPQS
ncbi:MAG TPA: hypothetical protein VMS11_11290 [Solirubrobacterales bacterium]|nr:hypothetical protein [Solirubrobacterales bacterium]